MSLTFLPRIHHPSTSRGVILLLLILVTVIFLLCSPLNSSTFSSSSSSSLSSSSPLSSNRLPQNSYPSVTSFDTRPEFIQEPLSLPPLHSRFKAQFPSLELPSTFDKPFLRALAKRLHHFLERSGYDYDSAQRLNTDGCPLELSDKLVNPDQYKGDVEFWEAINENVIVEKRAEVVRWLEERIKRGEEVVAAGNAGAGKGIVLTAGNQDTVKRTVTVLKHLKRLEVDLPIEIFHYPDELTNRKSRNELEELGARLVKVEGVEKEKGAWKNWQIKGLAIVQSSFREVLYLDSDNIPLRNPSHLFDAPLYRDNGRAVFWPDLSKDHPANAIWRIVGKPCTLNSWTFESGQIVIDKAGNRGLNLAALIIAAEMQNHRDFWFRFCGGDKDTFRWGFEILGLSFAESPRWMSAVGLENSWESGRFCGHTILQYDLVIPEGFTREPPLFVHSNLLKHLGAAGLHNGNVFTHVKRMTDDSAHFQTLNYARSFVYMGEARGMCLDLEWHPNADDLSAEERERVKIETIKVEDIEGGVFEGFENAFFEEGGRIGGW